MGIFDDLIPQGDQEQAAPNRGGLFDDLIPSDDGGGSGQETAETPPLEPKAATTGANSNDQERVAAQPASTQNDTLQDPASAERSEAEPNHLDLEVASIDQRVLEIRSKIENSRRSRDARLSADQRARLEAEITALEQRKDQIRLARAGSADLQSQDESQPISDLGERFARGATEVAASVPESLAIAGFGNHNASSLFAAEEIAKAQEQIRLANDRLAQNPELGEEAQQRILDVITEEKKKIAAHRPLVELSDGPLKPAASERALFKRGDQLRSASLELFGVPDPQFDDRFISKLAEGGGSMATFVGATLATGVVGAAALGSSSNASTLYREAQNEGASEDQARTAAYLGSLVGASEAVPIGRALDALPSESRKRVAKILGRRLSNAFLSAGEEGAQEALTQVANNLIAQGVWDSDRGVFDGAGEAALVGAVLGGGLGAAVGGSKDELRLDSPRLTERDRASPVPNDVIDDGKAIVDGILSGDGPVAPSQSASVERPSETIVSPSNEPNQSLPAAATPQLNSQAPAGPVHEILPVIDADGTETGEFVSVDPETGRASRVQPQNLEDAASHDETAPAIEPTHQVEVSRERDDIVSPTAPVENLAQPRTQEEFDREVEITAARRLRSRAEDPSNQLSEEARAAILESASDIESRLGVEPPVQVNERVRREPKPTLLKRPISNELKGRGVKINPSSPIGEELRARGITPRTAPGLFSADGVQDLDNLPAAEFGEYRYALGEDGNGYLSRDAIIEALEAEVRGDPLRVGQQAELQIALDSREAEERFRNSEPDPEPIDLSAQQGASAFIVRPEEDISTPDERYGTVVSSVDGTLAETGLTEVFSQSERQELIGRLDETGGSVEDAIWWQIHRSVENNAEPEPSVQPRLVNQPTDAEASGSVAPVQEISTDRAGPEQLAGTEDRGTAPDAKDQIADGGEKETVRNIVRPAPPVSEYATRGEFSSDGLDISFKPTRSPIGPKKIDASVDGEPLYLEIRYDPSSRNIEVEGVYNLDEVAGLDPEDPNVEGILSSGANSIGTSGIRKLVKGLSKVFPDAETISGFRVSGSRTGGNYKISDGRNARVALPGKPPSRNPYATEKTTAGQQAIIPGAEQDSERSAAARAIDDARQATARQRQSRIGTTVAQEDAGPLFDDQSQLDLDTVPEKTLKQASAVARGHAPARRSASSFSEARAAVREFQGSEIINRDSGISAVVSRNALDKMLSSKAVNQSESATSHSLAVANIDALFENSIHGWVKDDAKGEPSIKGIHRFFARLDKPDGGASMAKLTVKETVSDQKQNPLYTIEAVEFLEDGSSAATWVASALKTDGKELPDILSAEDLLNVARSVEDFNSGQSRVDQEKIQEVVDKLRSRLDQLVIRGVDLSLDKNLEDQGSTTFGKDGGISILIGNSLDGLNTVNHEAIHVLRARGLFKDAEWAALTKRADQEWIKKYDIEDRYSDLDRNAQVEEAIAEAFADFASNRKNMPDAPQSFSKIKRFFRALRETLTGAGVTKPDDIFTAVDRGEIGARADEIDGADETKYQRQIRISKPVQGLFGQPQPLHIPDRGVWDELSKGGNGIWGRISGGAAAAHDKIDRARILFQDRFLPVLRAQEAIERATGQPLPEGMQPYLAEETFSGKVGRHLFEIDEDFAKPIISRLAESKGAITVDTVGQWLTARHAEERNAYIASINDKMPDGGSGMSTADARKILDDVKKGPHAATYQRIGDLIDALRERTLDLRVEAGLMKANDAAVWRAQYKAYVPLKGFAETDHYDAMLEGEGVGRRFSTRGPESRQALGRKSEAFNPLIAAITQAQEVSVRAEKNRVGKALFDLVSQHESANMWSVRQVEMKRYFNKATGRVEERAVGPAAQRLEPNELAVKIDGKERRIVFHDERLARAAGTIGADQMGSVMRVMSSVSRYFSAVNTMLDPEFVVRNAFRDIQAAQINIRNFGKEDRNSIAKAMVRDWRKAFVAVYRGQGNHTDTDWTKWYKEFEQAGGKVSFWQLDQPEAGKDDLARRVRLATGNKAARALKVATSPTALFSTRDNKILSGIERTNLAVDNAIRLAAYAEARRKGWSKAKAASLSKNLTVNFNRRGTAGASLNAVYPFFNAAVQGSQVLIRAMTSRRMAKYAAGLVAYGVLEDAINASLSDEDLDGELAYDKIADWKLEMNFVIMASGGDAATIPMPYGYNVFPYVGKQIGKVRRGVKEPGEAFGDALSAVFSAFSPIAVDQSDNAGLSAVKFLSPMATDTLIETATNRDWLGRPIRPENPFNDYGPDAYKHYASVTDLGRFLADGLNRATGGNRAQSGGIDVSPEYIDHVFAFASGGAGRFAGRVSDTTSKLLRGEFDLSETFRVPFARSVHTGTGSWIDRDRYYRFRGEVLEAVEGIKIERETGDQVNDQMRSLASLHGDLKLADKQLRKIRKEKRAAGGNLSKSQRDDWARREGEIALRFNKKFIQKLGPQAE